MPVSNQASKDPLSSPGGQRRWARGIRPLSASEGGSFADVFFARREIVVGILLLTASVLTWNMTRPWVGYQSANGAQIGIMARNYLLYGYGMTKLGPVTNVGPLGGGGIRYHTRHPVMLPVLVSVSYRIFGISEASARLVPIVFMLAALLVWYQLLLLQWDRATAGRALFFLALVPMTTFYGQVVTHEPLTLFFVLMTLWCYLLWVKSGSLAAYAGMLLSLFLGTQSGWPAYLIVPFLVFHRMVCVATRPEERWKILGLPIAAVACFIFFLAHLWMIGGPDRLLDLYLGFTTRGFPGRHRLTPDVPTRTFLILAFAMYLFTPITLFLANGWLVLFGRKVARHEPLGPDVLVALLLGFGLLWPILFGHGTVHAYWTFYLGPFIGLSAALATGRVYRWAGAKGRGWAVALMIIVLGAFPVQAVAHTWYINTFRQAEHTVLYQLGLWIKENSSPETKGVVLTDRLFFYQVVDYYAERNLFFVGPELAGISGVQKAQFPAVQYVIAPLENLDHGQMTALPLCNWPPFKGYTCFQVTSDWLAIHKRDPGHTASAAEHRVLGTLQGARRQAGSLWELVSEKLQAFFAR